MLWIAIVGIIINGAAALKVKKGTSLNEHAVFLHILEDVLGWVAVLIVSIVMMFINLPVLDPILSIAISIWVLSNVYKNIRATFKILLQATPDTIPTAELTREITTIEGVDSIHDLHIWSMDGESHVMTLHVVTATNNTSRLKENILKIAGQYHIDHTTIEFELPGNNCTTNCDNWNAIAKKQ